METMRVNLSCQMKKLYVNSVDWVGLYQHILDGLIFLFPQIVEPCMKSGAK